MNNEEQKYQNKLKMLDYIFGFGIVIVVAVITYIALR